MRKKVLFSHFFRDKYIIRFNFIVSERKYKNRSDLKKKLFLFSCHLYSQIKIIKFTN